MKHLDYLTPFKTGKIDFYKLLMILLECIVFGAPFVLAIIKHLN